MELKLVKIKTDKCILSEKTFDVFTKKEYNSSSEIPPYPLLVEENEENHILIYCLQDFKQWRTHHKNIIAYVLPKKLKFSDLFGEVINYHIQQHDLNHFEISNILNMLQNKNFSFEEICKRFCPILNIAPTEDMVRDYLSLQNLNDTIVKLLISKNATLKQWLIFPKMDEQSQKFLEKIIDELQPSLSSLTQLSKNIVEIAKRENKETWEMIEELKLQKILQNNPKKTALKYLREIVKNARYPVLQQHKKEILEKIKSLNLPPSIKIITDKTLETKNYRLQINIESKKDIENSLNYLKENLDNLKDLINTL